MTNTTEALREQRDGNDPRSSERVEVEVTVNHSSLAMSLTNIAITCAAEIVSAAVKEILNVQQRDRRVKEATRLNLSLDDVASLAGP